MANRPLRVDPSDRGSASAARGRRPPPRPPGRGWLHRLLNLALLLILWTGLIGGGVIG
jgi:hypothetical protein